MKTVPPKALEDNDSFLKFTIAHVTDVTTMGALWNIRSTWRPPLVPALPELLSGVDLSAMLLDHIIRCSHGSVTSVIHSNGNCYRCRVRRQWVQVA
jgi:hypothetical protein